MPDQILEGLFSNLTDQHAREMLDRKSYGYDSFIEGTSLTDKCGRDLCGLSLLSKISKICHKNNTNTILPHLLHEMRFEDIHGGNFTLDNNKILHFIDAEMFQTKMAINPDDILGYRGDSDSDDDEAFPQIDTEKLRQIKDLSKQELPKLKSVPTRLGFCSTMHYQRPSSRPNSLTIKDYTLTELNDFNNYHTACLALFLHKNNFLLINEKEDINSLKEKINKCFKESNAIELISNEMNSSKKFGKGEIPAFYFHLSEKWIKCPITKVQIHLKEVSND